jgi:hypothetical protein
MACLPEVVFAETVAPPTGGESRHVASRRRQPKPGLGVAELTAPAFGPASTKLGHAMLGIIAAVLIVLWLLGFFAFHVTTAVIHVLLVIAVVMVVLHFMRGRRI